MMFPVYKRSFMVLKIILLAQKLKSIAIEIRSEEALEDSRTKGPSCRPQHGEKDAIAIEEALPHIPATVSKTSFHATPHEVQ